MGEEGRAARIWMLCDPAAPALHGHEWQLGALARQRVSTGVSLCVQPQHAVMTCRDPTGWLTIELHNTGAAPLALPDDTDKDAQVRTSAADTCASLCCCAFGFGLCNPEAQARNTIQPPPSPHLPTLKPRPLRCVASSWADFAAPLWFQQQHGHQGQPDQAASWRYQPRGRQGQRSGLRMSIADRCMHVCVGRACTMQAVADYAAAEQGQPNAQPPALLLACPAHKCRCVPPLIPVRPQARKVRCRCLKRWLEGWSLDSARGGAHPDMLRSCHGFMAAPHAPRFLQGDPAADCGPGAPGGGVPAGLGGRHAGHLSGRRLRGRGLHLLGLCRRRLPQLLLLEGKDT